MKQFKTLDKYAYRANLCCELLLHRGLFILIFNLCKVRLEYLIGFDKPLRKKFYFSLTLYDKCQDQTE